MTDTIWITGATSFTGQHLIPYLREHYPNAELAGTGRATGEHLKLDHYHACDLASLDHGMTKQFAERPPELLIHLASAMPPNEEDTLWRTNVQASYHLLTALFESGQHANCKVLNVSSAAEYHRQTSDAHKEDDCAVGFTPYGKSKAAQTRLMLSLSKELGIDCRIARPFNLLGPGLAKTFVAGRICDQLKQGLSSIQLGNLTPERDFVDVRDAIVAYDDIVNYGQAYEIYNVCHGVPTQIQTLVDLALASLETPPTIEYDEAIGGRSELNRVFGSNDKLCALNNWQPNYSLEDSLNDMMAHA